MLTLSLSLVCYRSFRLSISVVQMYEFHITFIVSRALKLSKTLPFIVILDKVTKIFDSFEISPFRKCLVILAKHLIQSIKRCGVGHDIPFIG